MKILQLASYFPKPGNPIIGTWALDQAQALHRAPGCSVQVVSLTPWLPMLPKAPRGYRAYATCPAHHRWGGLPVAYPRWPCYPIGPFWRPFHRNPALWMRLAWPVCRRSVLRVARGFAPDLIFAHHTAVNGWVARRLSRSLRVPFVCQDHDYGEIELCAKFPARRRLFAEVGDAASGMLVVSQAMRDKLAAFVPAQKVHVLYNGADPFVRGENGPAGARGRVVFGAGMLIERKGFEFVVRAWPEVARHYPDAKLRIAGDGPEFARLQQLARELGVANAVELLGYIGHDQVRTEMARARVFTLASWNEPFAVVYMEALAAGDPIIWGRDGGVAEVLRDGTNGFSVPPRDPDAVAKALIRLLADDTLASGIGAANEQLSAQRFTWDAVAREALRLFSGVAGTRGLVPGN